MTRYTLLLSLVFTALLSVNSYSETQKYDHIDEIPLTPWETEMDEAVYTNLQQSYAEEIKTLKSSQLEAANNKVIANMENYKPQLYIDAGVDNSSTRGLYAQISYEAAQQLLQYTKVAPHVADYFHDFYNKFGKELEDTDIGFCFGRAMFIRSALLKMKVQPNAIRKVIIIGDLRIWTYHIATAVYTDRGWMVLDPHYITGQPTSIQSWFETYSLLSAFTKHKSRLYVTDGLKFTARYIGAPTYEELAQLSEFDPNMDYYYGYFQGMADLFDIPYRAAKTLQRLGVTPLIGDVHGPGQLDKALLAKDTKRYQIIDGMPNYFDELHEFKELQKFITDKYEKLNIRTRDLTP